jgi:hypothetical protein
LFESENAAPHAGKVVAGVAAEIPEQGVVRCGTRDCLADPPGGVGGEPEPFAVIETLHRRIKPRLPSWIRSPSGTVDDW